MGYPEDSRLKANGEIDCGSQQCVLGRLCRLKANGEKDCRRQQNALGRLYVQNIEVLS